MKKKMKGKNSNFISRDNLFTFVVINRMWTEPSFGVICTA